MFYTLREWKGVPENSVGSAPAGRKDSEGIGDSFPTIGRIGGRAALEVDYCKLTSVAWRGLQPEDQGGGWTLGNAIEGGVKKVWQSKRVRIPERGGKDTWGEKPGWKGGDKFFNNGGDHIYK